MKDHTQIKAKTRDEWIAFLRIKYAAEFAILDANGIWYEFADYKEQEDTRYIGYPFIEALPIPLSDEEIIGKVQNYPDVPQNIKTLSPKQRHNYVTDIRMLVHPFDIYIDYANRIDEALRNGYLPRNPLPTAAAENNEESRKKKRRQKAMVTNIGLFGLPGMGKTTMLHELLNLYPQIIFHWQYGDQDFLETQLIWLIIECPDSASRGIFAESFYQAVDKIVPRGNYFADYAEGVSVGNKIANISTVCKNLNIGIVAIDEIQRLSKAKGGGPKLLLEMLVNISNTISMPIFYVGTNRAVPIVTPNVHFSRRFLHGDPAWEQWKEDSEEWDSLMNILEKFQYLINKFEIDDEMRSTLYEFSQGITSLAVNLYALSQQYAIKLADGYPKQEFLDGSTIRSAGAKHYGHLTQALRALESGDPDKLADFEDLISFPSHPFADGGRQDHPPSPKLQIAETNNKDSQPSAKDDPPSPQKKKPRKNKKNTASQIIDSNQDLRTIAHRGREERELSAYQALNEAGFIRHLNEFMDVPYPETGE